MNILSPSLLSADFKKLGEEIAAIDKAGAEYVHIDVMYGQFVPNISYGMPVIKSIRSCTKRVFDVHLMIDEPIRYVKDFADCGADIITVHVEACKDVAATLEAIRQLGVKPAITLNPDTPVSAIEPYLNQVDMVLVMSVVPGAGGQKFIPESLDKIRRIKKLLDENRLHADIEVDGGINTDNVRAALDAGVMRVDMMEKPTIAAVNGFALGGGCEMALACDIRIASEKAKFGQPEVGLGIIPGFGGTQRMARIIGTGPAMELIYTADTIDAQRALEIGMVNHVVPADQLMDEAMKLAQKICTNAQKAIRASKLAIRRGIDCDISTAVSYEALAFATCFGTEDQKEGMQAFLEKRKEKHFKNK